MKKILPSIILLHSISAFAQTEATDTVFSRDLDEVVIQGQKPEITAKDGIIAVDLPALVKDKPVTNILEALAYVPESSIIMV